MKKAKPTGETFILLLVEDDPAHVELIRRSFEGCRVANNIFQVSDGEAALDYLHGRGDYSNPKKSPRPHLVLLDLRLPRINGLEVLQEIKSSAELQNIPVVVLTTSNAEQDIARAYGLHANSYLVKPVDFDKFTELMDDLGFYWLGWNHYPWQ